MRLLICASILLAGCADADKGPARASILEVVGHLESKSLTEASGLARSQRRDGLLWAINDDGPADLYAMTTTGRKLGKVRVSKANNRDWEDLASFTLDNQPYLVIADIGDNEARRKDVKLYIVEEPDPGDDKVKIAWEIEFSYPDGPRDAEAIAVDPAAGHILVLSKRDIPAMMYELPLRPETDDTQIATPVIEVDSLPQPSRRDIDNALALKSSHWQPTGMDVASDGASLLILTYRGVYYYRRRDGATWADALGEPPLGLSIARYPNAESIAFGADDAAAFVTTEKRHPPLLRIDLGAVKKP